jgi:hypothetical protein
MGHKKAVWKTREWPEATESVNVGMLVWQDAPLQSGRPQQSFSLSLACTQGKNISGSPSPPRR